MAAVDARRCTAAALARRPLPGRVWAVALGKAAPAMLLGALEALGRDRVEAALAVAPPRELAAFPLPEGVEALAGGHPLPDEGSLAAGRRLVGFLEEAPAGAFLLFLISGGGSALAELPAPGVDLALLRRANAWLLASGLDIRAVNAVRRRLSLIKGGGLLRWVGGRRALALLVSDVPGDDPAVIASGPLFPPRGEPPLPPLPAWLAARLPPPPSLPPGVGRGPAWEVVAEARLALAGAAAVARERGLAVHLHPERLAGEAAEVGERLARFLLEHAAPGVHLWAGETTVRLPARPGRGGRCQHLALAAARLLAGREAALLAAGSDGRDGPGEAAGACVDGRTLERAPCDPEEALARADSGGCLGPTGALIHLGPTGTNVADLVLGLVSGPSPLKKGGAGSPQGAERP